jgi:RNA polymerase sigma-70 factor (ECF subfamily)
LPETRGHGRIFDSAQIALAQSIARRQVEAILRHTAPLADREDVVACAIERLWAQRSSLRVDDRFPGWVCRIARNAAFDYLRSRAAHPGALEDYEDTDPSNPERELRRERIRRALLHALSGLPEAQREIWILKEIDGLSYKQIAEVRGISENTVGPSLAAARTRLVRELTALGFAP